MQFTDSYYVYQHMLNGEIVYVGVGKEGRAWEISTRHGRSKEHFSAMFDSFKNGDVGVSLLYTDLTKSEACSIERRLLAELEPKFNIAGTSREVRNPVRGSLHHNTSLSEEDVLNIREAYDSKQFTNSQIANKFGINPQAVSKIGLRQRWSHL